MIQNALINEFDEIIRWPKKQSDKTYIIEFFYHRNLNVIYNMLKKMLM
ncbi:uncharacterized protein METZ01_LOCUS159170 [marine metagenome]|uniref:Uncharacterized protein n=1 Tax=marine metagenome TaxID=408172 RepID=A0A382AXP8_9ZZZZ